MFSKGKSQADVVYTLGVSRQSASRWHRVWKKGGVGALRSAGRLGRKPQLDADQLGQVDEALRLGPRAHGFNTELWTLPRAASVIKRLTGVEYHPGHVWRVLRAMGWSLQRPAKKARERNEEAVLRWMAQTWPRVKKTPGAKRRG